MKKRLQFRPQFFVSRLADQHQRLLPRLVDRRDRRGVAVHRRHVVLLRELSTQRVGVVLRDVARLLARIDEADEHERRESLVAELCAALADLDVRLLEPLTARLERLLRVHREADADDVTKHRKLQHVARRRRCVGNVP
jgi:hypothetical protein